MGGRAEGEREREETESSQTAHCEGDRRGERGRASSDFRDALESASAWLVFPVGGLIRGSAQGRIKSEAQRRQTEARVQRERGSVGARRTRALCSWAQGCEPRPPTGPSQACDQKSPVRLERQDQGGTAAV